MRLLFSKRRPKNNRINPGKRSGHVRLPLADRALRVALPVIVAGVLVLALFQGWRALSSRTWLAITRIVIEGEFTHIKPEHLIALINLQKNENLLFADTTEWIERLTRHPWVKTVEIKRRYPHTLVVTAIEEIPTVVLANSDFYYVSKEGHPFKKVEKGESMDFPILMLPGNADPSRLSADAQKMLHEMIDFLNKYEQTRFAKEFGASELVARIDGLSLFTKEGGLQVESSWQDRDEELWKLDKYYKTILVQDHHAQVLNLKVKGKIIASAAHPGGVGGELERVYK